MKTTSNSDTTVLTTTSVEVITAEGGISMTQAAHVADECFADFGGRRASTHPTTPLRWHKRGHRRADGTRVFLEAIRFGGKWLTSRAAIIRFISAQQEGGAAPSVRSPAERQRAADNARRDLKATGAI